MLASCLGCGGQEAISDPAPPERCAAGTPGAFAAFHQARVSHTALAPAARTCLLSLPGLPRDAEVLLALALDGHRGAFASFRQAFRRQVGSLSLADQLLALDHEEGYGLVLERAELSARRHDRERAMELVEEALHAGSDDPWMVGLYVELLEQQGQERAEIRARIDAVAGAWRATAAGLATRARFTRPNGLERFALRAQRVARLRWEVERGQAAAGHALAALYERQPERWPDALAALSDSSSLALTRRADIEWSTGALDDALRTLQEGRQRYPRSALLLEVLAQRLRMLGQAPAAREVEMARVALLRDEAAAVTDDPVAWATLAYTRATLDDDAEQARDDAKHVVALTGRRPEGLSVAGYVEEVQGDLEAAAMWYEKADGALLDEAEAHPDRPLLWVRLATHRLDRLRDVERSAEALERVKSSELPEVWFARCRLAEKQDALDAAAEACEEATRLAPLWPAPRRRLVELSQTPPAQEEALHDLIATQPAQPAYRLRLVRLLATHDPGAAWRELDVMVAWPGPATRVFEYARDELLARGLLAQARLLNRMMLAPHAQSDVRFWTAEASAARAHQDWSAGLRAATQASKLSGDAHALLHHAEEAAAADARARALTALDALLAAPHAPGVDWHRVARIARHLKANRRAKLAWCLAQAASRDERAACRAER